MGTDSARRLLTIKQTAQEFNLAEKTIRVWVALRRLDSIHLGRAVRIPASEIDRLIADGRVPAVKAT